MKSYIQSELKRNEAATALFSAIIRKAYGLNDQVLIAHHLEFAGPVGTLTEVNEIPSADTLIFDHDVMHAVFGDRYIDVMVDCAKTPVAKRDACLKAHWDALQAGKEFLYVTQDDPADNLDSMVGWQNDKQLNAVAA